VITVSTAFLARVLIPLETTSVGNGFLALIIPFIFPNSRISQSLAVAHFTFQHLPRRACSTPMAATDSGLFRRQAGVGIGATAGAPAIAFIASFYFHRQCRSKAQTPISQAGEESEQNEHSNNKYWSTHGANASLYCGTLLPLKKYIRITNLTALNRDAHIYQHTYIQSWYNTSFPHT
jgi:hypothetical protein